MTKWFHKCSLAWLQARQGCLTATDVKDLLPVTRTGRKRTIGDEDYLKVLARKQVTITEGDCISAGAAARGHILEPYAIDTFNQTQYDSSKLLHWDDVVVTKKNHSYMGLAFSPDSTNFPMDYEVRRSNQVVFEPSGFTKIGEVKSYSPEKHLVCGYTDKMDLEERWQLATAMAVAPDIETAFLIFYNPSVRAQLFVHEYSRMDLLSEIDQVLDVEDKWLTWIDNVYPMLDNALVYSGSGMYEQAIIAEIMKREELNPEGEKSVVL